MARAYTPVGAAKAAAVTVFDIEGAIRDRALVARKQGNGKNNDVLVLATDLQAWLESLPNFYDADPAKQKVAVDE